MPLPATETCWPARLSITSLRWFAATWAREEDRERRGDRLQIGTTTSVPRSGGSSWQSLERGTGSIEAEFLNGEIVLLGALFGVETPVNAALQTLAVQAAAEGRPAGTWDPGELAAAAGVAGETGVAGDG